jgi:hypothetical protein
MAFKSNGRNAILLVVCGLLLGPANGATPPNANTSRRGDTIVTLPVGEAHGTSAIAIAIPITSVHVTPSKLVSRRDLEFRRAEEQWRAFRITLLMYQSDSAHRPSPVVVVSSFQVGGKEHIWVQRTPRSQPGIEETDVEIATIEHLYSLALEQNPEAGFCLSGFGHTCSEPGSDYTHPRLLRELAEARERNLMSAHRTVTSVPWRSVTMVAEPKGAGPDRVGVRITLQGTPLADATAIFNRAPHSGCKAKGSFDGVVTCELVDQHGDEDPDEDKEHTPILATFPGDVQRDRILLPTTLTWYLRP